MANETIYDNAITVAAQVANTIVPHFRSNVTIGNLVVPFQAGPNSRSLRLPRSGSVQATAVGEAALITPDTLVDTASTLTIAKIAAATKPTLEALKFADAVNIDRHANELRAACVERYERDLMGLATGFSQSVDSGTSTTISSLIEAGYLVRKANIPVQNVDFVGSYGQGQDIINEVRTATGAIFGNSNFDPNVQRDGVPSGFLTSMFGTNIMQSGYVLQDSGDDVGIVMARQYALAGLFPSGNMTPEFQIDVSEHSEFLNGVITIRALMWYAVGEYVDEAGVEFRSDF